MIKIVAALIAIACMVSGCQKKASPEALIPGPDSRSLVSFTDSEEQTLIDIEQSVIEWKGTKLMGTGKHEGTVKFSEGWLSVSEGIIEGGYFEVDMRSIFVTDIPLSQAKAHRNLTNHLKSDFVSELFPTASFTITHAELTGPDTYQITGNMAIKGITKYLTISAIRSGDHYTSEFTFNRFDWKIGEDGSWLERRMVDADVHLKVKLFVQETYE